MNQLARLFGTAAFVALATGCYAEASTPPVFVEAAAPADIEAYPAYQYEGRTVYYVNDRWYARDRGQWRYYRYEPVALRLHRAELVRVPPPERHADNRMPAEIR